MRRHGRRCAGCHRCGLALRPDSGRKHGGNAAAYRASASRGKRGGVAAPHAHPIRIRDAAELELSQLNEIAHPRPLEAAQNRAAGAVMIDENELRRFESGDEDVERCQVAVDVSGAMQSCDLRAERAQHDAPGRELCTPQIARKIRSVNARGYYDLASAAALGAEQQNFRDSHAVGAETLRYRRNVRRARPLEYPPDSIQAADRVEHFEIGVRTPNLIEMLEPCLGMTRAADGG